MNRILILGASGFIGQALYKELRPYFDVYGTYFKQEGAYRENQVYFPFEVEQNGLEELLDSLRPQIVISCIKGPDAATHKLHEHLVDHALDHGTRVIYLSSQKVYDAQGAYPAYEYDPPQSISKEGKKHIAIERILAGLPAAQRLVLRLPLVLGVNAPLIFQMKQAAKHQASFEVYPNAIVSATTVDKLAQQVHYLINKQKSGIYHLSSTDVMHHEDLFREICQKVCNRPPIFKSVYDSNEDRYQAILPKHQMLPRNYRITIPEVIAASTLNEDIETIKQS